jgi:hypothetical protein
LRITSIFLPATVSAVLLHVELDGAVDLAAGRCERTGHRQDQADLDRVLRGGAAGDQRCGERARGERSFEHVVLQ